MRGRRSVGRRHLGAFSEQLLAGGRRTPEKAVRRRNRSSSDRRASRRKAKRARLQAHRVLPSLTVSPAPVVSRLALMAALRRRLVSPCHMIPPQSTRIGHPRHSSHWTPTAHQVSGPISWALMWHAVSGRWSARSTCRSVAASSRCRSTGRSKTEGQLRLGTPGKGLCMRPFDLRLSHRLRVSSGCRLARRSELESTGGVATKGIGKSSRAGRMRCEEGRSAMLRGRGRERNLFGETEKERVSLRTDGTVDRSLSGSTLAEPTQ